MVWKTFRKQTPGGVNEVTTKQKTQFLRRISFPKTFQRVFGPSRERQARRGVDRGGQDRPGIPDGFFAAGHLKLVQAPRPPAWPLLFCRDGSSTPH